MSIQHAFLKELRDSAPAADDDDSPGITLHSSSTGHGSQASRGGGLDFGIVLHAGEVEDGEGTGAPMPEINLAVIHRDLKKQNGNKDLPEDPDKLPAGARIELYAIVYKSYRPGPAFQAGHVLTAGALDAQISPGGKTWRGFLDGLPPAVGGVPWSEHIMRIARRSVRLDPLQGRQIGSGFLFGSGNIMTAGHVLRDFGWLKEVPSKEPARILYNRVHLPGSQAAGEADIRSSGCSRHPDIKEDAGVILQAADWQAQLDAAFAAGEFGSLGGLEWQDTPIAESDLKNRPIAVIGHPLHDNGGISGADLPEVYGDAALGTKRFMPGFLDSAMPLVQDGLLLKHDCSTLGGASGACAIDLLTGKVIGIHIGGSVSLHNYLVPIWRLVNWLSPRGGVVIAGADLPKADPGEAAAG